MEENEKRAGELTFQLLMQVGAHNHKGWSTPLTGVGAYFGYSHFFNIQHRLSCGAELTQRNGLQALVIPDYHYEWVKGRFRTAIGMELMAGYCAGFGFAAGLQPNFEIGYFVSYGFAITLGIGYRMMYYSSPSAETKKEVGKNIFEIPINIAVKF